MIGIGSDNFRKVPVDADYRIDVEALRRMISADRAAGCQPFCIVGNAGTVNTGAIDPLDELADIAKEHNLWLHVDGAFGAIPKLLPEFAGALKGLELADSLSFDFRKWMYVNYEAALRVSFATHNYTGGIYFRSKLPDPARTRFICRPRGV